MARFHSIRGAAAIVLAALLSPMALLAEDVRVVVGFYGQADAEVFARHGGRAAAGPAPHGTIAGYVSPAEVGSLQAEPGVAYVEEDLVRQATIAPNDTYYAAEQADLRVIRCEAAWDVTRGTGVRVAVIDTGCQTTHPDIAGRVVAQRNFTSKNATDTSDRDGHGTHTAGTIGATTNNAKGVAGVGWDCRLAIGKVLGPMGGYDSWVAAGIDWASQTAGAKVINMSLGGAGTTSTLEDAVNRAWANGVVVVAAAGNDGTSSQFYPAAYANCIAVAATDNADALASFSNFGAWVDIAAPGVRVLSTYKGNAYAYLSGTSMASPHVAGVAALVWASPFGTSSSAVRAQIEGTATVVVGTPDASPLHRLDAAAAVTVPAGQ